MAKLSKGVSIIISMVNAEDSIARTLESLLAQTYENWEAIVIDNGCEDRSRQMVEFYQKKDSRIRLLYLSTFTSHEMAWNRGRREAKGRYLAFLLAGDVWKNQKLELQLNSMKKIGKPFYYSAYNVEDESGKVLKTIFHAPTYLSKDRLLSGYHVDLSTVLLDRDALRIPDFLDDPASDTCFYLELLNQCQLAGGMDVVLVTKVGEENLKAKAIGFKNRIEQGWNLFNRTLKMGVFASSYYIAATIVHGFLHPQD